MTHRERREARAERLRGWADTRVERAEQVFIANEPYTSDYAFNTQPGHIPARARIIRQEDRAHESLAKAAGMAARADGIDAQLAWSIYDDDADAVERLTERIALLEEERDRMKAANAAYRKAHRDELAGMTAFGRGQAVPFPPYALSNLSGNLKRNRDRLVRLTMQQARTIAAADAGGTVVEEQGRYAVVTFAEKPAREVLDALKAAGFRWTKGSWTGPADRLPDGIR